MAEIDEKESYKDFEERIEEDIGHKGFFFVDSRVLDGVDFRNNEKADFINMLSSGEYKGHKVLSEHDSAELYIYFIYDDSKVSPERIDSVCDLLEKVYEYRSEKVNRYFRGEKAYYQLVPSLFRDKDWVETEMELNARVYNDRPSDFTDCHSTFDRLVKLKHFVHPSRLLDISASPLVALFFACDSTEMDENATGVILEIYCRKEEEKFSVSSDTVIMLTAMTNTQMTPCRENPQVSCKEPRENIIPKAQGGSCFDSCIKKAKGKNYSRRRKNKLLKKPKNEAWVNYIEELVHQCKKEGLPVYWDDLCYCELNQCILVKPPLNNDRIVRQQGSFIMCGMNPEDIYKPPESLYKFFRYKDDNYQGVKAGGSTDVQKDTESSKKDGCDEVVEKEEGDAVARFYYILPSKKRPILDELEMLGLNEYYFFPELEREIKVVRESVKNK